MTKPVTFDLPSEGDDGPDVKAMETDLDLIKRTLREIIENKSSGHDAGDRIEAIRLLYELIKQ